MQNFKIVAQPLLGEKFVVGGGGGVVGGWVVCKPILVFSLGFGQAEQKRQKVAQYIRKLRE